MKMNSVTDTDFICKLSEASKAGVKIDMIVRGICCIRPGVEGYTDNLNVISIVGRFLEHARIFSFGTGAEQRIYIGSADMMTRNTEKRVEVACPVYDKQLKRQLTQMLKVMLADNQKARVLQSDGTYKKKEERANKICAQEYFMKEAISVKKPEAAPEKKPFLVQVRNFLHRRGNK